MYQETDRDSKNKQDKYLPEPYLWVLYKEEVARLKLYIELVEFK